MRKDPRHIAVTVLLHWQASSQTLDRSLEKFSQTISALSKNDKNLCNALIFGVLRQRASIDWILEHCSDMPLKKISPFALYLLRITLFQILHMDRIPVFAAINTAVDIAKKTLGQKTAGFMNAVLRNACQNASKISLPDPKKDSALFISVRYSMPLWLARKWEKTFGFETTCTLCAQINTIPDITLRVNTLKADIHCLTELITPHTKAVHPTVYSACGLNFTGPDTAIHEMDAFKSGLFQIQDEAAQLVTELMAPEPCETVLDACAGLGGKTGHIAQLMNNQGSITALDIDPGKLEALNLEARRLGLHIIQTRPVDLMQATIKDFDTYFDRVLLDAPCSGLGVLRRNPDTKWKRTQKDIERLAAKQKKLLNAAANLVKPGGVLVYAVCSCEKEENEDVIHSFLNKRKDFSIDKNIGSDTYSVFMTDEGFLKTYPAVNTMDGFFAARLTRISKT
ncbi:MAG: 16S rRNA (cytosine(967)-C(5))-methyltransferase RsmB [Proteobacteria bacterium]|nr:16S rRNA (cytosine(967)-C(5))-methyltransferase RsmB [Pseudomonadota bacterium]MBU1388766.1 16S rRNA (cytosine(967)-C(5))-methyltransferase RsmB [Pseudomonadota bacterium]MBU1543107.1 16S rRNA (cytosine(967)-C(5))-methyltransferase RsmB [Pseudomonadota bacterium]MBU2431404.1 16S rRNA (cytosine(967)-C(5))-methyltransferase RsmB [Pseudomonadota bacterium]MBU2483165.1 16S rRNA (cytosine(967)-C(5))-methyltransferase RsmB [Pseudomonadota bacterium]